MLGFDCLNYAADYNTCTVHAKTSPELVSLLESLDGYDEIYLDYPNYWRTMPRAVYTFLEKYEWTGKTIHPSCTHEGSDLARTEKMPIENIPRWA
ncbi:MAG: hypothetical protein LUD16_07360 [Lachnospiraceae bacterium]|nr:hypothetical protein [Lachnospiraceae bacterium]